MALALYREILRAHRKLPAEMRSLGDAYVKEEFRKHKSAKAKFLPPFFAAWQDYLRHLKAQDPSAGTIGSDLKPEHVAALNDEQREQLAKLRSEVDKRS